MAKLFTGNVDNLEESVMQLLSLIKNPVGHMTKSLLSASLTDLRHSSGMPPHPIRRSQPPPRQDTLPPEEIELIAQVAAFQQTLHEVAQELKNKKNPKPTKDTSNNSRERLKRLKGKMNRASNENTTGQESTTFQIMYYNALIRELIKEFTKQIKHLGRVVQINIIYSEMSTTFVFIRRLKINGTLEA